MSHAETVLEITGGTLQELALLKHRLHMNMNSINMLRGPCISVRTRPNYYYYKGLLQASSAHACVGMLAAVAAAAMPAEAANSASKSHFQTPNPETPPITTIYMLLAPTAREDA